MKIIIRLFCALLSLIIFQIFMTCNSNEPAYSSSSEIDCIGELKLGEWQKEVLLNDSVSINFQVETEDAVFINFKSNPNYLITFSIPNLSLSHKTNVRDIVKEFPQSAKLVRLGGNAWSGKIELFASEIFANQRIWTLYFFSESLVALKFHDPLQEVYGKKLTWSDVKIYD